MHTSASLLRLDVIATQPGISKSRGTLNVPQTSIILIIGTPIRVPLFSGTPSPYLKHPAARSVKLPKRSVVRESYGSERDGDLILSYSGC